MNSRLLRVTSVLGLALVLTSLAPGCVVLDFSKDQSRHRPPAAPLPLVPESDAAVVSEIRAASRLNYESSRLEALNGLATRPGLSPTAQVHLASAILGSLTYESSRVEAATRLINNPATTDEALRFITDHLQAFTFESSRVSVLAAIQARRSAARN